MVYEIKIFRHIFEINELSKQLLENHLSLYQAYVANTNKLLEILKNFIKEGKTSGPEFAELKRRFGWEFNGMRLHEFYFGSMIKEGRKLDETSALLKKIIANFGSYSEWEKDFKATALSRGIGWVILYLDQITGNLMNVWVNEHDVGHLSGAIPILVIDMFEHAYMIDYGLKKAEYIDAFLKIIDWKEVAKRVGNAIK